MRLAIIGGGSIGRRHAQNARALGHGVLVYDTNPDRGLPMTDFLMVHTEGVLICTPAATHEAVAEQVLARGYRGPLFVEKPLALSSAAPVFQTWPHPVTMVGYNWRFHPLARPRYSGRPSWVSLECCTDMGSWPGTSYADPLLECSHELDLALAIMGPSTAVTEAWRDEERAVIRLTHAAGVSSVLLRWNDGALRRFSFKFADGTWCQVCPAVVGHAHGLQDSYREELTHFVACIFEQRAPQCTFRDGLAVLDILNQVRRRVT